MKKKQVAAILALILGLFGVHRFYLGQRNKGILHFSSFIMGLLCIIFLPNLEIAPLFFVVPLILGLIDSVLFFVMPKEEFDYKYNKNNFTWSKRELVDYKDEVSTNSPLFHKQEGIRKYQMHDYHAAIKDFQKALDQEYNDPSIHYNLACCFSILEESDNAFFHLDKAVNFGQDINQISTHQSLTFIRNHPDYDSFVSYGYKVANDELVPPTFPLSTNTTNDHLEKILELGKLKEKGFLTEEEFNMQKQRLLLPRE